MKMKSIASLWMGAALLCCAPEPPAAQPEPTGDEAAALLAVERFFETMTKKDSLGARSVLDPAGDFVSVRWNEDGERVVRRTSNQSYLESLETQPETYLERMWDPEVRVNGPIAMIWTPYDLYVDGQFSHCGIDIFQLLQSETGWIITGGTYTVQRTGCPDSPLGPPGG